MASPPKILLTGASDFIGSSVLDNLIASPHPLLAHAPITCLVRGAERIAVLNDRYGHRVNPILHRDLDDTERIAEVASEHDIAINTTLGYHAFSAAALVRGLAKRKQATGKAVYLIHTSGTSNLADQPISKAYMETEPERVFDDARDDVYAYEKMREAIEPYHQRTAELGVIDAGLELDVKTLVIMSPTIHGKGSGRFNTSSIQIPTCVRAAMALGQAVVVGNGAGVWDNVHVADLADLYTLVVLNNFERDGADLPFGEAGVIFSETSWHRWRDTARGVAEAAFAAGKVSTREVTSVGLEEGAKVLAGGDARMAELGFCSSSRTRGVVVRERLGWKPSRAEVQKPGRGGFGRRSRRLTSR